MFNVQCVATWVCSTFHILFETLKPTLLPVPINSVKLSVPSTKCCLCSLIPIPVPSSCTSAPLYQYQYQYSFIPVPVPSSSTSAYKLHQTVCAIDEVLFGPLAYNQQLQLCAQCLNPGHNFIKYCAP